MREESSGSSKTSDRSRSPKSDDGSMNISSVFLLVCVGLFEARANDEAALLSVVDFVFCRGPCTAAANLNTWSAEKKDKCPSQKIKPRTLNFSRTRVGSETVDSE